MSGIKRVKSNYISRKYWENKCYVQLDNSGLNLDNSYDFIILYFKPSHKSFLYTSVINLKPESIKMFDISFKFGGEEKFDYLITKDEALNLILPQKL